VRSGKAVFKISPGKKLMRYRLNSWAWLSVPVIPAIQKAEIRRILVLGQPRQKVHKTTSHQKKSGHGGVSIIPSSTGSIKQENCVPGQLWQKVRPYLQNNLGRKDWRCGSNDRAPA
jgi:hypothetical protein